MRRTRPLARLLATSLAASVLSVAPVTAAVAAPDVVITEVRINGGGDANQEYVEIAGAASTDLSSLTYLVIGDGTGGSGVIEAVVPLTGLVGSSGFYVVAEDTFTLATADQTAALNFENGDNVTHLLVEGFSGADGDDLDTDDDGTLDVTPWTTEVDRVALIEEDNPPTGTEFHYGPPTVGPDGSFVPAQITLCPEGWRIGSFSSAAGDTPGAENDCDPSAVAVHDVQGAGADSPLVGQLVQVQAVVTSIFEDDDEVSGVFIQEEDADADADADTSEGVYVDCATNCPADVAQGDLVTVVGLAEEFFGRTQIDATPDYASATIDSSDNPLPTAAEVVLPAATGTDEELTFEHVEGMVIAIPTTLAVSEYFELARFGQVVLTAVERPQQFTQTNAPSNEGYDAFLDDLATRRIVLDDGNGDSNDAIFGPDADEAYPFPAGGLSLTNGFRGGDTITGLTGVMDYGFGEWKIQPVDSAPITFTSANPRTDAPAEVGGELTVASFNVLNYFTTIDDGTTKCPADSVSTEDLGCRGADSTAEFVRQQAKIVAAINALDADVVGLIELENADGVIADLVDALNADAGEATWAGVETGPVGPDVIRVGLIHKPASVTPVGDPAVLDSDAFVNAGTEAPRNRAAVAQTYADGDGALFTVAVNHFKSKSGSEYDDRPDGRCVDEDALNDTLNCDQGDGAAYFNLARTIAAQELDAWLATDPTGSGDDDVLVVGDLNAYAMEDPVQALEDAGWTNLAVLFEGDDTYSYLFDGQLGTLDYAFANPALLDQVTGVATWHINADELPLLDYNDAVLDDTERSFERESDALELYAADAYRSSDHDPVLVGLSLDAPPVADAGGPYTVANDRAALLDASASSDPEGDALAYSWDLDDDGVFDDAQIARPFFEADGREPGTYPVAVKVRDRAGHESVAESTVEVIIADVPFERIAGADREATAARISADTYPDGATTAVLAVSSRYPDALAAAPLASLLGAPILLTDTDTLPQVTRDELERLGVTKVVIVGGEAAISEAVADDLGADYDVERVAGADRYATAVEIAEAVVAGLPAEAEVRAYIAQGQPRAGQSSSDGWQDALGAAPIAAFEQAILLLTRSTALPAATDRALTDLAVQSAVVVGGTAAVSAEVYDAIDANVPGELVRVFGADRYATAAAAARYAELRGMDPASTWIATGRTFPDALVAGPAVAAAGGTLLLVDGTDADAYPDSPGERWLEEHAVEVERVTILGGIKAITDAVRDAIAATLER